MRLADLPAPTIEKIKAYHFDRIIEKHEGPARWASVLTYYDPEFMEIEGYQVLLPVVRENHPNITILRCIVSRDEQTLTIFLKDMTLKEFYEDDRYWEMFGAGFVAICDKVAGEAFYIAILYHEWFITE